jgi:hypothetical protein
MALDLTETRQPFLPLPGGEGQSLRPREREKVPEGRMRADGEKPTPVGEGERGPSHALGVHGKGSVGRATPCAPPSIILHNVAVGFVEQFLVGVQLVFEQRAA